MSLYDAVTRLDDPKLRPSCRGAAAAPSPTRTGHTVSSTGCNACHIGATQRTEGRVSMTDDAAPMDWRNQAACLDLDPELWFPVGTTGPAVEQTERAKAVCAGCPVTAHCLAWALETGQSDGIWGGKTADERRALRRARRQRHPRLRPPTDGEQGGQ
jgi:WhiB family redox-sensing transcriptional regulator